MTPNEYKERRAALDAEFYGNSSSHVGGGGNKNKVIISITDDISFLNKYNPIIKTAQPNVPIHPGRDYWFTILIENNKQGNCSLTQLYYDAIISKYGVSKQGSVVVVGEWTMLTFLPVLHINN